MLTIRNDREFGLDPYNMEVDEVLGVDKMGWWKYVTIKGLDGVYRRSPYGSRWFWESSLEHWNRWSDLKLDCFGYEDKTGVVSMR